jgi:hypothetical protein
MLYYADLVDGWGLNNKLFFLKQNLFTARLLNRTLVLPSKLRTLWRKSCIEPSVCDEHFGTDKGFGWYIPLHMLLDVSTLNAYGAVFVDPDNLTRVNVAKPHRGLDAVWVEAISKWMLEPCEQEYDWYQMDVVHSFRRLRQRKEIIYPKYLGWAVQVDSIKTRVECAFGVCYQRLNISYHNSLLAPSPSTIRNLRFEWRVADSATRSTERPADASTCLSY